MPLEVHNQAGSPPNQVVQPTKAHRRVVSRRGVLLQTAARRISTTIHCRMEVKIGIRLHQPVNMLHHYHHTTNLIPFNQETCISITLQIDKPLALITNQYVDQITPAVLIRGKF